MQPRSAPPKPTPPGSSKAPGPKGPSVLFVGEGDASIEPMIAAGRRVRRETRPPRPAPRSCSDPARPRPASRTSGSGRAKRRKKWSWKDNDNQGDHGTYPVNGNHKPFRQIDKRNAYLQDRASGNRLRSRGSRYFFLTIGSREPIPRRSRCKTELRSGLFALP